MLTRNNYDNTNRKQQSTKYFLFLQRMDMHDHYYKITATNFSSLTSIIFLRNK